ncbi:MAG: hypothetical protein K2X81_28160, partial [Candidatus Obscuribacterales bacterium]|nr:hypothetical protein [Candidatus Obscuribacterales bacterium]
CAENKVEVGLGKQVIVGQDAGTDFHAVNPTPQIAVREIKSQPLKNGLRAYSADFSILSALLNHESLKGLNKTEDPVLRQHFEQVLKTACVLTYVTSKHGAFKVR